MEHSLPSLAKSWESTPDGLTWIDGGGRTFVLSLKDLAAWRGNRGDAGRVRPDRFLTNNKFGSAPTNGKPRDGE